MKGRTTLTSNFITFSVLWVMSLILRKKCKFCFALQNWSSRLRFMYYVRDNKGRRLSSILDFIPLFSFWRYAPIFIEQKISSSSHWFAETLLISSSEQNNTILARYVLMELRYITMHRISCIFQVRIGHHWLLFNFEMNNHDLSYFLFSSLL